MRASVFTGLVVVGLATAEVALGQAPPGKWDSLPPPAEHVVEGPGMEGPYLPLPGRVPVSPCPPPKLWEGGVELGLNGTQGNSETFNFRFGANGKRKRPDRELSLDFTYLKNSTSGVETANRALLDARNEWLDCQSPWTVFVHGTLEYDEFKAFDVRLTGDLGVGYQFIKDDWTTLVGRVGPGFSQEIGGPDDALVPEAVLGAEWERKLSDRQKVSASATLFPALDDLGDYRFDGKAAWEVLVDPAWNLTMQVAVIDRYDSTPHGARKNDFEYSLLFLWAF
jgi:putative salt-induced outer membrane protein YdiY